VNLQVVRAIKENAAALAKRIVRVVEEPEPIYREKLSSEKMEELERRIYRLLKEGDPKADVIRILELSDRDAARVLNKMESLEKSIYSSFRRFLRKNASWRPKIRQIGRTKPGRHSLRFGTGTFRPTPE